jgi:signal transduction histidine kinase
MQRFYDKTSKNLANIRRQIQQVSNPEYTAMTGEEKKEEINRLKQLMSTVAEQAETTRKLIKREAAP